MKLSAILFTVILLLAGTTFVGCSFNTRDKIRTAAHDSNSALPEISLKKDTTVPLLRPLNKQYTSPKRAIPDLVNFPLAIIEDEGIRDDGDVIPPPTEEDDSIHVQKDDIDVGFMCTLEKEAEYPGGAAAWSRFLKTNLKFPTDSNGNAIVGTVKVKFLIDEEGNVCDVEAVSGSAVLGAEAVRVIMKSGKWIPGKLYTNGRHIKSYKTQPVIFRE